MVNLAQMGGFQRHTVSIDNAEWIRCKGGLASFSRYNEMINHYVGWEVRVNDDDIAANNPRSSRKTNMEDYFTELYDNGLDAHNETENGPPDKNNELTEETEAIFCKLYYS